MEVNARFFMRSGPHGCSSNELAVNVSGRHQKTEASGSLVTISTASESSPRCRATSARSVTIPIAWPVRTSSPPIISVANDIQSSSARSSPR